MRLTMRTELAMRTLMFCAVQPDRIVRKHEIAIACGASENHLAQVIHTLGQRGFLRTLRGRAGGVLLGRPMEEITVGQVFRALEGEVPFTDCADHSTVDCPLKDVCRLQCAINKALAAFFTTLDQVTLANLVEDNDGLARQLRLVA
ncbi:RrF2 family transcriptional regulator [Falsigemmobacter faecalis]|uniref:Rrf2 family transcriptional regulator n=1 Tax=Falsigemmobacter faecalis TaxID=2488730 RepID=A0A3P3DN38_9RHOB|nr:Rrf2 family transcriptional regulator [Falsigemmobacter faecalis]RRH75106.1 Rrf2 family transcriptional regulator [Falsigemmobacter faecalis]